MEVAQDRWLPIPYSSLRSDQSRWINFEVHFWIFRHIYGQFISRNTAIVSKQQPTAFLRHSFHRRQLQFAQHLTCYDQLHRPNLGDERGAFHQIRKNP